MRCTSRIYVDVLVVGSGLAGLTAAISAAEEGARTAIISRGRLCSGSSFYPGTWGLGLVAPEDEKDVPDLEETILRIGEGMANPALVHTFTGKIMGSLEYLEHLGVPLREAKANKEREFIPCFDHKNRLWKGIEKPGSSQMMSKRLRELKVACLEHMTIIRLLKEGERVCGALAVKRKDEGFSLVEILSPAVILATGGMGGLFTHRLTTDDVTGIGQYLALESGAKLFNLEFMQMMLGHVHPAPKTIYNEKMFRFSRFYGADKELFSEWEEEEREKQLELRSGYGPFTTRLSSKKVDLEIYKESQRRREGIRVVYQEEVKRHQPEFIKTYFDWLKEEKNLTMDDLVWLSMYAHASNGGIAIDEEAFTGVEGLYACGEVTGGMHGADRLGGLSSANGLVFGRIAGKAAARSERGKKEGKAAYYYQPLYVILEAKKYLHTIQKLNQQHAMLIRSERGSKNVLQELSKLQSQMERDKTPLEKTDCSMEELLRTVDLEAALELTLALHQAILLRRESRGPHYREDCPKRVNGLNIPIYSWKQDQEIVTHLQMSKFT